MMKRFIKWSMIILFILTALSLGGLGLYVSSIYSSAKSTPLDEELLNSTSLNIKIYDSNNKPLKEDNEISHAYANIDILPEYISDF